MPLPPDPTSLGPRGDRGLANSALVWNRRLHYYLGLYLLFFTWLFVLSGLLLNHPKWQFAEFWPNRVQTTEEYEIGVKPEPPQVQATFTNNQLRVQVTTAAGSIALTSNVTGTGSCVVIGMNGNSIASSNDLHRELGKHRVGDTVTVTVLRDGQRHDLPVTLQPRSWARQPAERR